MEYFLDSYQVSKLLYRVFLVSFTKKKKLFCTIKVCLCQRGTENLDNNGLTKKTIVSDLPDYNIIENLSCRYVRLVMSKLHDNPEEVKQLHPR